MFEKLGVAGYKIRKSILVLFYLWFTLDYYVHSIQGWFEIHSFISQNVQKSINWIFTPNLHITDV